MSGIADQPNRPESTGHSKRHRLSLAFPELEYYLTRGEPRDSPRFGVTDVKCETVCVSMRDGIRLATDVYLPAALPAPVIAIRSPYGRATDRVVAVLMAFARRGYVVVSQDCRGTGDSEPDTWDYYVFETDDSYDLVDWISKQDWCSGFIGSCGGSYLGVTQWPMATHRAMSTIVPHVSGLGFAVNTTHLHMFLNGYARVVGKGADKLAGVHYSEIERLIQAETMETGFFSEPLHKPFSAALLARFPNIGSMRPSAAKRWLWEHYCASSCNERAQFVKAAMDVNRVTILAAEALSEVFGHQIPHDALTIPHARPAELCRMINAPVLLITSWYDWGLNDALATWEHLRRDGNEHVAKRSRLVITPHAHHTLGYHEAADTHPELQIMPGINSQFGVLLSWYQAVQAGETDDWPTIIYYLMGANEWRIADDWPPTEAKPVAFYLQGVGGLTTGEPEHFSEPDRYTYDPKDPTPTVGGSIVSYIYPPGSVDVCSVQQRDDVRTYTSEPLEQDLDLIGPLRMILYASSSACDTDFAARLSDVFPDGRAIQLQNGVLRARYRNPEGEPELLEPGKIYRFEIDLWATANRFKIGHRIRVDISSADFPRFDRNSNRGAEPGEPVAAEQTIYHDAVHPSHLLVSVRDSTQ